MSDNSNLNDFYECEKTITELQNEIQEKISLLNAKQSDLRNNIPAEKIKQEWLQSIENILSNVLMKKTEELEENLLAKESDYLKLKSLLNEFHSQQVTALICLTNDIAKDKLELKKLQKSLKYLDNKKLFETDSDSEDSNNIEDLNSKSLKIFSKSKNYLNYVLNEFHDKSMEDLIKELTNAYFRGGEEQYIYAEDDNSVLKLYRMGLIVQHPIDKNKIKFDKIF